MILVPAFGRATGALLHRDSERDDLVLVDVLTGGDPDDELLAEAARRAEVDQAAALPWASIERAVWSGGDDGQPAGVHAGTSKSDPIVLDGHQQVARLSSCEARLDGVGVSGWIDSAAAEALPLILRAVLPAAAWDLPLGTALVSVLERLMRDRGAHLRIDGGVMSLVSMEELRRMALLEWAARLATSAGATESALVLPARRATLDADPDGAAVRIDPCSADLKLDWSKGDLVRLRRLHLRFAAPEQARSPAPAARTGLTLPEGPITVSAGAGTAWDELFFIQVGFRAPRVHEDITLTPAATAATWTLPRDPGGPVRVHAIAGPRRYQARLRLPVPKLSGDSLEVVVPRFRPASLVLEADRALLQQTGGDLSVTVAHPALAGTLIPESGPVRWPPLSPDSSRSRAVWRGLLWEGGADRDFLLTLRGGGADLVSRQPVGESVWQAHADRLGLLRVIAVGSAGAPVVVEAGVGERAGAVTSIGRRTLEPDAIGAWTRGDLPTWLRAVEVLPDGDQVVGPWREAAGAGVQRAPRLRPRDVVVLARAGGPGVLDVELRPDLADAEPARVRAEAGEVVRATLFDDPESTFVSYRSRAASPDEQPGPWSDWLRVAGLVVTPNLPAGEPSSAQSEDGAGPC